MTGYDPKTMASLTSNLRAMLPTIAEEEAGANPSDRSALPPSETTSMLLHWASALQRCITPIVKELDSLKGRMDDVERKLQAGMPSTGLLCSHFDRQLADLEQREEEHRSRLTQAVVQVAEEVHRFCKSTIALPVIGEDPVEIATLPCAARREDLKTEAVPLAKETRRDESGGNAAESMMLLDVSTRSIGRQVGDSVAARDSLQRASEDFDDAIHASLRLISTPAQHEQKQGHPVPTQTQTQTQALTQTQPGKELSNRPSSPLAWVKMQALSRWATPSTSVDALSDTTIGSSVSDLAPSIGQLSGRRPLSADRTVISGTNMAAKRGGSSRSGTSSSSISHSPLPRATARSPPDGSFPVIPAIPCKFSSRNSLPARLSRPPVGSGPHVRSPMQLSCDRINVAGQQHLDATQPLSARSSSTGPIGSGPLDSGPCGTGPIGSSNSVSGGSCAASIGGGSCTPMPCDTSGSSSPSRASSRANSLGVPPLRISPAVTAASHMQNDRWTGVSTGIATAALASFNESGQAPRTAGSSPSAVPPTMAVPASSICKAWSRQDLSCRAIRR